MSVLGDAFSTLRNVVLMQERIDVMNRKLDRMSSDLRDLNDYALAIDKRVIRIETLIEFGARTGRSSPPQIEE